MIIHIILGLIQLGEYEEVTNYILQIQKMQALQEETFSDIKDSYVQAMLMSKLSMAKEKQVKLKVTKDSHLMEHHGYVSEDDLTTILGNLIENAIEACSETGREEVVRVRLTEDEERIQIQVSDSGPKIPKEREEKMFELGASKKGQGRGTGLYLVGKRIELYHGTITLEQRKRIKTFYVVLNKNSEKKNLR